MTLHLLNRLDLYKESQNKKNSSNGIVKKSLKTKQQNKTTKSYNHSLLLNQIEAKLIPSLQLISITSENYANDLKKYSNAKQEYQKSLKTYHQKIQDEIQRGKEQKLKEETEKEKKLKEENLKKQKEQEQKQAIILKQEAAKQEKLKESAKFIYSFIRVQQEFQGNQTRINEIKKTIKEPVLQNTDLKKLLNKHKRLLNPKFGQLTNSRRQLMEISSKMIELVNQTKADSLAYSWILNFIAKSLVHQAELECRVKPEMAIPLAELTHVLTSQFPELIPQFLIPRLIKKCPLILGFMSNDKKEMGFKVKQGEESKAVYVERMDGILAYYGTLCKLSNKNHVFIHSIWKMITRWANMELNMMDGDLVLGSLVTVLECCGNELFIKFGRQVEKLIAVFLQGDFEKTFASSVNWKRLSIAVEDRNSSGKFKSYPNLVND